MDIYGFYAGLLLSAMIVWAVQEAGAGVPHAIKIGLVFIVLLFNCHGIIALLWAIRNGWHSGSIAHLGKRIPAYPYEDYRSEDPFSYWSSMTSWLSLVIAMFLVATWSSVLIWQHWKDL